jgi:hypothetical protein
MNGLAERRVIAVPKRNAVTGGPCWQRLRVST